MPNCIAAMRTIAVFLLVLLAGCAERPEGPSDEGPTAEPVFLPDDLHVNATMPPSLATPGADLGDDTCTFPAEVCHQYPISLPGRFVLTAHLVAPSAAWSNLDLHLFEAGESIAMADSFSSDDFLRLTLPAGDYEVVVQGQVSLVDFQDGAGTPYQLDVWFEEPRSP
jgi:hypothetical protein